MEKLTALLDACSELGVDTGPRTIGDLGIIPLFSWYHKVAYFSLIHCHKFSNQIKMHHVTMIFLLTRLCLIALQSFDKEKDVNSVRVPSLEMVS